MSMQHVLDASEITEIVLKGIVRPIPASTKLALMAICDDASEHTNLSWPGMEKVCKWAVVKERQAAKILADLIANDWLERVSGAAPGRRAVYRVTVPPRPRKPVDNPEKMGASQRTHSGERLHSGVKTPAPQRIPLRINSPDDNNQVVTEADLEAAGDNSTIRPESIEGEHKRSWPVRLIKGSGRKKLDRARLTEMVAPWFEEIRQEYPKTWTDQLDELANGILHRARRSEISDETKYVFASISNDLEMFRSEMWSRLGGAHARSR